ncbi:MAG: hypothetical protein RLZ98_1701 [Pseudomonadota bacterium]
MNNAALANMPAAPADVVSWRRDIHAHPELLYDVHRTASLVRDKLQSFGCDEVVVGLGRTGVVGIVRGARTDSGKVIGLRADMDALPILEQGKLDYVSTVPGKMHACGHDGHTAMLLGAARELCRDRNFNGTIVFIFQPAEEGGAGARAMIRDGLLERFGIQEVYGMHNLPGLPIGHFAIRPGPIMAASDILEIVVEGRGGHAAKPNECIDPVLTSAHILTALQSVVARNTDPLEAAVVSICMIEGGAAFNVIPDRVTMKGTARSLTPEVRALLEARILDVAEGTARAFGATARVNFRHGYPVTRNDEAKTAFAGAVAADVAGPANVDNFAPPVMGGEDFSFMLEQRPGAFIFVGNGDSAGLHNPAYDFNDEAIAYGMGYWSRLVHCAMPL